MSASRPTGRVRSSGASDLLAALLDGMDTALCAFDAKGAVTHWNREAERMLGWSAAEAVGRPGLAGWAVRAADADDVQRRLLGCMDAPGRQVGEFALLAKDGGRVLVRFQACGVRGPDGRPAGVYCAFSEVRTQIDLERSVALSEALFADAAWGVVLVDADLRPAVVNPYASRALGGDRGCLLGSPLGELLSVGAEDLEGVLQFVLAEGAPPEPLDVWVTLRGSEEVRRCWRSGFVRLATPLAEEPVPLGVGWFFQDVTTARRQEQENSLLRFRGNQLHRAGRAAVECEQPLEAAAVHVDFALAGFADHALIDLATAEEPVRLVRVAGTPEGAPGPCTPVASGGVPVRYFDGHPALLAVERTGSVRASAGDEVVPGQWAGERGWPADVMRALCVVLRSRGRTLGVLTFLRGPGRAAFGRADAAYAEDVAVRVAGALDLAACLEVPADAS